MTLSVLPLAVCQVCLLRPSALTRSVRVWKQNVRDDLVDLSGRRAATEVVAPTVQCRIKIGPSCDVIHSLRRPTVIMHEAVDDDVASKTEHVTHEAKVDEVLMSIVADPRFLRRTDQAYPQQSSRCRLLST